MYFTLTILNFGFDAIIAVPALRILLYTIPSSFLKQRLSSSSIFLPLQLSISLFHLIFSNALF